jgi:hypothetical protein
MIRPFPHFDLARLSMPAGMIPAALRPARRSKPDRGARKESNRTFDLPKRPDLTVLSESIPLFYIGQNRQGCWVVRESEGRSGGRFIFRRSALRFARKQSAPLGCALMFLNEPLELDVENRGGRTFESIVAAMDRARHLAPTFAVLVEMAITKWRTVVSEISRAIAGERRNRAAIERELFHGQYMLSSKNDDDLPIP